MLIGICFTSTFTNLTQNFMFIHCSRFLSLNFPRKVYYGQVLLPLLFWNERLIWSKAHVNQVGTWSNVPGYISLLDSTPKQHAADNPGIKLSHLVVCIDNSEIFKMSSFMSLSPLSTCHTYESKMMLFWISVDLSSCNVNNFNFLNLFCELRFVSSPISDIHLSPFNCIYQQWDVFHFTYRRLV
jgi:hypothetical protein